MISAPSDIVTPAELEEASSKRRKDIYFEFTNVTIEQQSLIMNLEIKLNFVMSKYLEKKIKERLLTKLDSIRDVKIHSVFENTESSPRKAEKQKSNSRITSGSKSMNTIYGKRGLAKQIPFEEIKEYVGTPQEIAVEGEIFKTETKDIKADSLLLTIYLAHGMKTVYTKVFMKKKKYETISQHINTGDMVRISGVAEFDRYSNDNVISIKSIEHAEKPDKKDKHKGCKRVELHVHTKMSDNDGFNDVEELVNQAAAWGHSAVAITDHGVVQAFPDAAKTAKKLATLGKKIKIIYGMEGYLYPDEDALREDGSIDIKKHGSFHIILLAKNLTGLKNLYKLVSISHIDYFYKRPRIPRSILKKHREGLIIGSACEAGEVYRAVRNKLPDEELDRIAEFYDYLEIQPLGNNVFMLDAGYVSSMQELKDNNLKIVEVADRLGKPVVATTDSHYPTAESAIYRNIVMSGIGFKESGAGNLYLRTTDEMIEEFSYLGDRTEEIVITNTNRIADMIEEFEPVPKGKFPPKIPGAAEKLRKICYERAAMIYGENMHNDIKSRLDEELNAIIGNGYAVMYIAAQMLVKKSNDDGYLVGSRGSVGSSFAATMSGITEVNPLEPHYVCPKCKWFEFYGKPEICDCGFDMPDKICPNCGTELRKDGLSISFATFLGFKGDKEPDIDLNFAGEYQGKAHKYVGEIFGDKNIFKAGTVATIADKTAYGYVRHYLEENNIHASKCDEEYLLRGCLGVKRTTGQHPGGIIIVPEDHEIYEFCPIQKPANKRDVDIITTHFDYHKIEKNLLKLDILGHDVPQMIRHLQNMTGVDPMDIKLDDKKTLSIFTSIDALDIKEKSYKLVHGTYGIPEFGTAFTRQMLDDIKPTTISELIKISGFSHGTDVWTNNAQDLIRKGTATVNEVISSRDDIMYYLINKGIEKSDAFRIMEDVRKNRELTETELELMKDHGVPDWYIESCRTLKYLFPRAHAAAYVMMAIRMAWFKVYYPAEFYAAYLTTKIDDFDISVATGNIRSVGKELDALEKLGYSATAKEKGKLTVCQIIYELMSRGLEFGSPEPGVSDPCIFNVIDGKIKMPFMAVSGIGKSAAESLDEAYRKKGPFTSLDDVKRKTRLSATNIEDLDRYSVFGDIPQSAQISIFDLQDIG